MTDRRTAYWTLAGGLAALYGLVFWMVAHGVVARAPKLMGAATTADLTVTAALATWALGVRRGYLHRRTPFIVVALGFVAARLILPSNARDGFVMLRVAWSVAELVLVLAVIVQARQIHRRLRALRLSGLALVDALEQALVPAIGVLPSRLLATEMSVMGYAFAGWRRKAPPEDECTFSMHRRSHYGVIVGVLIFLVIGESIVLHLFVARLSNAVAWLLSASSLWVSLWLIGDAHAMRLNPLHLTRDGLVVSVGIRWRTSVPYNVIKMVAVADGAPRSPTTLHATVASAANVRLVVTRPLQARGIFGRIRSFDTLLLTVDRPDAFIAALQAASTRDGVS